VERTRVPGRNGGLSRRSTSPQRLRSTTRSQRIPASGERCFDVKAHLVMVGEVMDRLRAYGIDTPVVVGGIVPEVDRATLLRLGRASDLHPEGLRHHPHHDRTLRIGRRRPVAKSAYIFRQRGEVGQHLCSWSSGGLQLMNALVGDPQEPADVAHGETLSGEGQDASAG
jgi:hypothetical protein